MISQRTYDFSGESVTQPRVVVVGGVRKGQIPHLSVVMPAFPEMVWM